MHQVARSLFGGTWPTVFPQTFFSHRRRQGNSRGLKKAIEWGDAEGTARFN